jgi:hypothetical protein
MFEVLLAVEQLRFKFATNRRNTSCLFILISLVVDSRNINGTSRSFIVNCCRHSGGAATESNIPVAGGGSHFDV